MALEIQATPVLEGEDAERFLKHLSEAKTHIPTQEDMSEALRIYNNSKELRQGLVNSNGF